MEEMVYEIKMHKPTVLDSGAYNQIPYRICSVGFHPVAYVSVPANHKMYHKLRELENIIKVHGGITYCANTLYTEDFGIEDGHWIGWDYAHCGDYSGIFLKHRPFIGELKVWTTAEILEDVKSVIKQLEVME